LVKKTKGILGVKGKSSNISFQNYYTRKVVKAISFIKFIRRNKF
jgi:hypothetical protein